MSMDEAREAIAALTNAAKEGSLMIEDGAKETKEEDAVDNESADDDIVVDEDAPDEEPISDDEQEEEDTGHEDDADEITTDLLLDAGKLGMTKDQISAFRSASALRAALGLIKPKEDAVEEEQQPEETFEFDKDFLEEYDGVLVDQMKKMEAFYQGKLADLEAQVGQSIQGVNQMTQQAQEQYQKEVDDTMDSTLDGIDGFGRMFGKGIPTKGTPEFDNRVAVAEQLNTLLIADQIAGRNTSVDVLTQQAVQLAFPDKYRESIKNGLVKKVSKRERMRAEKPTGGAEQLSEEDRIVEKLKRMHDFTRE